MDNNSVKLYSLIKQSAWYNSPFIAHTLGGAITGGLTGAMIPQSRQNNHRLRNTLLGAAGGAILGNVGGRLYKNYRTLSSINKDLISNRLDKYLGLGRTNNTVGRGSNISNTNNVFKSKYDIGKSPSRTSGGPKGPTGPNNTGGPGGPGPGKPPRRNWKNPRKQPNPSYTSKPNTNTNNVNQNVNNTANTNTNTAAQTATKSTTHTYNNIDTSTPGTFLYSLLRKGISTNDYPFTRAGTILGGLAGGTLGYTAMNDYFKDGSGGYTLPVLSGLMGAAAGSFIGGATAYNTLGKWFRRKYILNKVNQQFARHMGGEGNIAKLSPEELQKHIRDFTSSGALNDYRTSDLEHVYSYFNSIRKGESIPGYFIDSPNKVILNRFLTTPPPAVEKVKPEPLIGPGQMIAGGIGGAALLDAFRGNN